MPRMYFIGVTTGASSIHRIFPRWAALAGAAGAELTGIDLPLGAPPEHYREAATRVKTDPQSRGALVTTHKVGLYRHARNLFDEFDDDARRLGEVSCIVRRGGALHGLAIDTLTAELSLRGILDGADFRGEALILGAGGAGLALAVALERHHQPTRLTLTDISSSRLEELAALVSARTILVSGPADHSRLLRELPPGSLIVNATGLGKDRPGFPLTPDARFPSASIAWDFNYRGDLRWLRQARAQGARAVDGWNYFLHGWSRIMGRVFGFELTPELFQAFEQAAEPLRLRKGG